MARHREGYANFGESDSLFLYGVAPEEIKTLFESHVTAHLWNRTLRDAGMGEEIAQIGISLDNFPSDKVQLQVFTDATRVGSISVGVDLVAATMKQFAAARADDGRYENVTDRWKKVPDRVQGYIPADAGSVRWTLLHSSLFNSVNWDLMNNAEVNTRVLRAIGTAWAYMASPKFIPAPVALDLVTARPPEASAIGEIRLPHRYSMVFHDGVPVQVITGGEDLIDSFAADAVIDEETLVIGGVLAADDIDRPLSSGFILLARKDSEGDYTWQPVHVPLGSHPAGRVLYNYAALLAWEDWTAPPKVPQSQRGRAGSANQVKKLARTEEGRQGAYHQVWVLDHRPPPEQELAEPRGSDPDAPKRSLKYRTERRGYFTERKRYGIRDENGKLVGPVYKEGAVEGETFIRRRRFVRRADVRQDLPERPATSTVYRVPEDAHQVER